ncbi:hypothetical protein D9758_005054 [Tetrapyrgos nigripes]|uniref:Uncharacterized protein n=1 Tax=Tetrapyrgos nigripes TaxID=182062 RepID=A0A8H5GW44_9AGAR|nr:hypothetical protein D9758_005054 [Tetrapyrgos nigripes]
MKLATTIVITALTLVGYVSAQGALIEDLSREPQICSSVVSSTFFASNDGECYPHDGLTPLRLGSDVSEDCAVTFYTDGDCTSSPSIATVGACFVDIQSFSIDCS